MRILHCLHNYDPARGGSEWLMKNVSEKLTQRNHHVQVIASNAYSVEDFFLPGRGHNLIQIPEEEINGVQVSRVPFSRRGARVLNLLRGMANRFPFPFANRIRMISWGPRSKTYSKALQQCQDIDVIAACPLPTLNIWYAWKAAAKQNLPLVIIPCFHTEDPYTYSNPYYFSMLRDAHAIIALTEWERDYLIHNGGIDPKKIHTLGVGIDLDGPEPQANIRDTYNIESQEIVLFLGQHGPHKGILNLIEAMPHIWKERQDVALIIAGNPTVHTQEIEEKINQLPGTEKNKIFLIKGFPEEEKRAFLKAADVFVSISSHESFGIVFLEAWQDKIAVIGCRRGGASHLIEEFRNGLQVQYGHVSELAGAVLALLEDQEWRQQLGENGYQKIGTHFTWDKIINLWEKIYEDALQQHRASN